MFGRPEEKEGLGVGVRVVCYQFINAQDKSNT